MANGTLHLARKPHQPISFQFIDQNREIQEVSIVIHEIIGQQARIVIDAPKSVSISRRETITSKGLI